MSDAGEGLIDAESRIQERMEELERARFEKSLQDVRDPEAVRALESLRLARAELERQLQSTTHERRRAHLEQAISEVFDLRPAAIIRDLDLLRPIYSQTAAYGHFGRELPDFTWERTDRVDALRSAAGI